MWQKPPVIIIAVLAIVGLFFLFQSANKKTTPAVGDEQTTTVVKTSPTSTPTPSQTVKPTSSNLQPSSPDAGIEDAEAKLNQALRAPNASQLQTLLTNDVVLGSDSGGQIDQASNKADVVNWLNTHWSGNLQYVSKHYVQHFGYWELTTTGWSNVQSGTVNFRFFRYDANGQRQAFEGDWLIYAALY